MAGEDYWPNSESEHIVKDLCDAFATNLHPEEHIVVNLWFQYHQYHLQPDFTFDFKVGRISEGENIVLSQGTAAGYGYKERLDIVRAISNSPKHIVEIVFGYEYWPFLKGLGEKGLEEWCELMLGWKDRATLRSLTLNTHEGIDEFYDEGVEAMASMLAHHPSLKHFTLKGWRIHSNKIAASLAKVLSMNEKLETLTLDHFMVNSIALDILLQPLIPNDSGIQSKLEGLYLLHLLIMDDSFGKVISNMLQKNITLYEFGISVYFSKFAIQEYIEILKALKENQHLKRVKFQGVNFVGDEILWGVMSLLYKNPSLKVDLHDTPPRGV